MKFTKLEKETIINLNEAEDIAWVYTRSKPWMKYMEKVLGLEPTKSTAYSREYQLPKAWIRKPRIPRHLSDNQKQQCAKRLPSMPKAAKSSLPSGESQEQEVMTLI